MLVAVGYSGQKLRSLDGGHTWTEPSIDPRVGQQEDSSCDPESEECKLLCTGGDDKCLLRDVTFHDGLFVAVGWKIFTSPGGLEWTERTVEKQQWMGGVEYGNGGWLAVGGCGQFLSSENGVDWLKGGSATDGCGHLRNLTFGAGVFVALGAYNGGNRKGEAIALWATGPDDLSSIAEEGLGTFVDFQDGQFVANLKHIDGQPAPTGHAISVDGTTWAQLDAPLPAQKLGDAYFRQSQKRIKRSEDGQNWEAVSPELPGGSSGFARGWTKL